MAQVLPIVSRQGLRDSYTWLEVGDSLITAYSQGSVVGDDCLSSLLLEGGPQKVVHADMPLDSRSLEVSQSDGSVER